MVVQSEPTWGRTQDPGEATPDPTTGDLKQPGSLSFSCTVGTPHLLCMPPGEAGCWMGSKWAGDRVYHLPSVCEALGCTPDSPPPTWVATNNPLLFSSPRDPLVQVNLRLGMVVHAYKPVFRSLRQEGCFKVSISLG